MSKAELSVIIVNWNSKEYVRKCLRSILRDDERPPLEIIVVDNASYDGCDNMLQTEFQGVRYIQNDRNIGFAGANNLGYTEATAGCLLFLNPDTEVRPGSLRAMWKNLQSLPKAGAIGARLLNGDGSVQITCIQAFPTISNQLLGTDLLHNLFPLSRLWGARPLFAGDGIPVAVDVVSGACLMIKRPVFESIGMFSTEYFMYSEDVDLCLNVKSAGWKTYYVPQAVVVHHGGGSSSQSNVNTFSSIMMLESRWRFFRKTKPLWYCYLFRLGTCFFSAFRIVMISLIGSVSILLCKRRTPFEAILTKWMKRLHWSLGGEKWVKSYKE